MNCIVPITQQCPGLLTGNRHRNSRSTRFQVIQKPGFSRSTRIQTLNTLDLDDADQAVELD